MLNELYKYALDHDLAARPGFKHKRLKGYLSLTADGKLLGFDPAVEPAYCPDMGGAAQSTDKCNVLVEKAGIVLGLNESKVKHAFFLDALVEGGEQIPAFAVCAKSIQDEEIRQEMEDALVSQKIKPGDAIGFKVDGVALERNIDQYAEWWEQFRARYCSTKGKKESRCLVTGELTTPTRTVPKVSGLMGVGGHTAGDALICFDKVAFQSYGLDQAANAAVSEEAITAVNAALTELIRKAPVLAGAKWVHWYDAEIPSEADPFNAFNDHAGDVEFEDDENESAEANEAGDVDESGQTNESGDYAQRQKKSIVERSRQAEYVKNADKLIKSAYSGERVEILHARYHILCLSGASGRMMIRVYTQGSYEELSNNLRQWQDDLRIVTPSGRGLTQPPKMLAVNIRLLGTRKSGDIRKLRERIDKELSSMETQLLMAIINDHPLPDTVAARALQFIRSDMQSSDQDGKDFGESVAFQLLKAWLVRIQRKRGGEVTVAERVNESNTSVATLVGRMMAVFAKIQETALGDVNAGVVQRYYTAASTTPALVIGKLSDLSQHHLGKIEKGLTIYYNKMLADIWQKIKSPIPATLTLEQKTEFALGYYQQIAEMYTRKSKEDEQDGDQ